jgi:hypothetical protein
MALRTPFATRRLLAPLLATLSFASLVVGPVLDSMDWSHGAAIESAHDAERCVRGHDHSICTQVVASRALPADGARHHSRAPAQRSVTMAEASEWALFRHTELLPLGPRAPPAV